MGGQVIPYGYCHCGCGEKAPISPKNNLSQGYIKGEPRKYLHGHNFQYKGNIRKQNGYVKVKTPEGHPRAGSGYIFEHILIAERQLGRFLKQGEVVHHINQCRTDNRPENLAIMTQSEHMTLHMRLDALAQCGHADYRKCAYCKEYDDPSNMVIKYTRKQYFHAKCHVSFLEEIKEKYRLKRALAGNKKDKLSLEKARAIRQDNRKLTEIAKDYGICFQTVSDVKRNRTWIDKELPCR